MIILTTPVQPHRLCAGLVALLLAVVTGCSNSSNPPPPPPPPPPTPASITLAGVVTDGPVSGGSLFVFAAADVQAALDSVDPNGDRLDALSAAPSIAVLTRDPLDEDQYSLAVGNDLAGTPVFFVFDNAGAEDGVPTKHTKIEQSK